MNSTPNRRDAASELHWGVLAFILVVFAWLAGMAALRGTWVAVAIALSGFAVFGKSAWTKYRRWRNGDSHPAAHPDEARAISLTPRIAFIVCALGLLNPLYFMRSPGNLAFGDIAALWPLFVLLWVSGIFISSCVVYLFRYVAHYVVRGIRDGRGNDA